MNTAMLNGVLAGILFGVGYYVAARAMEVLALRVVGGSMRIGAVVIGLFVRLTGAAVAFWLLIQWTDLPLAALSIGFLGAYNVVLVSDVIRLRRLFSGAPTPSIPQETLHGRH